MTNGVDETLVAGIALRTDIGVFGAAGGTLESQFFGWPDLHGASIDFVRLTVKSFAVTTSDLHDGDVAPFGASGTGTWEIPSTAAPAAPVPEPASLLLVGLGLAGAVAARRWGA